jgi:ABC-type nickel/cobalt efflux system permease component RcnA
MKNIGIDIIFPWEVGLVLAVIGVIIIIIGVKQGKKEIDDFDKILLVKPTTKILFGGVLVIFGLIQLLQLLN